MPKISVNILTKNRAELLQKALASVARQSMRDFELVVVNDGSTDGTEDLLKDLNIENLKIIRHRDSLGITAGRQEALLASTGDYIAILDDDDDWVDVDKLKKQAEFLDNHAHYVLVGGGIKANDKFQISNFKFRPKTDQEIRRTMLLRNNFFTSTVMFRRAAALQAGGFVSDGVDLAEDYDLWLRLGKLGKMHNFQEVFTSYRQPQYNKDKFKQFLAKQLNLVRIHSKDYPFGRLSAIILKIRNPQSAIFNHI